MATRRTKGTGGARQLPSGSWRTEVVGPDGKRRSKTFATKTAALAYLAEQQTDVGRKSWRPPEPGKETLETYTERWLQRPGIKESTRDGDRYNVGRWITPFLGDVALSDLTPATVRAWHTEISKKTGKAMVALSYRNLRAILNMALADDLIAVNPCRIAGAGASPKAPTRAVTPGEVAALAAAVPARYKALVLFSAWNGTRPGETFELRPSDLNLDAGTVTISRRRYTHLGSGTTSVDSPKSQEGTRTIHMPEAVCVALRAHLEEFPGEYVFTTRTGGPLSRHSWGDLVHRAAERAGIADLTPYALRSAGATYAAQTGATLKETMARLGHSSPDAAMRYQRVAEERDQAIASALNDVIVSGANVVPMRKKKAV